jgi:hypothetical protein
MTHHLPTAPQATAQGVDHGWNGKRGTTRTGSTTTKQTPTHMPPSNCSSGGWWVHQGQTTRDDGDGADPAPAPAPTPMPTSNCLSGGWRVHQDRMTTRGMTGTKQTTSTHPHADEQLLVGWMVGAPGPKKG